MKAKVKNSLLDSFLERLKEIKESVTAEDRRLAMLSIGVNYVTICRYLNGAGSNLQMAERILKFFLARIRERENVLA